MHTTTVRVDVELWEAIRRDAARLGVGISTYMRDAARERVARAELMRRVERLEARTDRLEAAGRRILRRLAAR